MTSTPHDWLPLLRHHTDRFAAVLATADPDTRVTYCPDWCVRDLAVHLGGVHQWAAHAVTAGDPSLEPTVPGPGRDALVEWYRSSADGLLDVLTATPVDAPAWSLDKQDPTAGFWRRRQVHETAVHLWDVEEAIGTPSPMDPLLAWDGVREVAEVMYPRQVRLGRVAPLAPGVRLVATDVDGDLTLGDGEHLVVRERAEVLLRLLWHRLPAADLDPDVRALLAVAIAP